ncbi:MAG: hypothetical protein PT977_03395 [Acidobacteriota bacterium]|nr:hypothetical protein [Acidobacteriota bacterium]
MSLKTPFPAALVATLAAFAVAPGPLWAQPLSSPPGNVSVQANASSDELAAASQLGAQAVRAIPNVSWLGIERVVGGGYDWSSPDANQRLVQSHGLEYYRVINSSRPDDPGKPSCATDQGTMFLLSPNLRTPYQDFVKAAVERYDGDGAFDMSGLTAPVRRWSYTPENGTYFCPQGDVTGFATMFQLTADAVHAADPTAEVLLPLNAPGVYLCAFADGYFARATIDFKGQNLTRSQVSTQYAQNIAYTKALIAAIRPDAYDLHLYGDADSIPARKKWLLDYVASQGLPARPVYAMEGGEPFADFGERFPTGPSTCPGTGSVAEDASRLAFQSGSLVKHFVLALSSGYGTVTSNLFSEYGDFGTNFGDLDLLDACHRPRPAFATYQLVRQKLVPFASAVEMAGLPAGVRAFRFTFAAPRSDVYVAWDSSAAGGGITPRDLSAFLPFATATVTHAVTAAGASGPLVTSEPSSAVALGATPVFLEGMGRVLPRPVVAGPGLPPVPRLPHR